MRSFTSPVVAICIALVVSACATSASRMAELQVGMSRADVLARLGEPERSEASDAQEKLYFWLSESRVNEAMFGGVMRGLNIGKGKYIVTLESGRVVSYRKTSRGE